MSTPMPFEGGSRPIYLEPSLVVFRWFLRGHGLFSYSVEGEHQTLVFGQQVRTFATVIERLSLASLVLYRGRLALLALGSLVVAFGAHWLTRDEQLSVFSAEKALRHSGEIVSRITSENYGEILQSTGIFGSGTV